ncbi:hypothetical protein GWK47_045617 [Chionoecetes opilio]|uniref:Uncharacterized protein n=1 Tax=Chionoecetes opilio TaxID=41210 RepID=A0A8J4Y6Z5_CHIOP|nr:hypothetical protein GWK47_045617 [Chionoecetes opilio]
MRLLEGPAAPSRSRCVLPQLPPGGAGGFRGISAWNGPQRAAQYGGWGSCQNVRPPQRTALSTNVKITHGTCSATLRSTEPSVEVRHCCPARRPGPWPSARLPQLPGGEHGFAGRKCASVAVNSGRGASPGVGACRWAAMDIGIPPRPR